MSAEGYDENLAWSGVDRFGTNRCGRAPRNSGHLLVERLFGQRWQRLSVFDGDIEVGGIGPHPDTGHRVWWASAVEDACTIPQTATTTDGE